MEGYKNPMQAPRIMKVVVSTGVGSFKDKNKFKVVEDRLGKLICVRQTVQESRERPCLLEVADGVEPGVGSNGDRRLAVLL